MVIILFKGRHRVKPNFHWENSQGVIYGFQKNYELVSISIGLCFSATVATSIEN